MKERKTDTPESEARRRLLLSLLLLMLALVGVTTVTVAWFTIADNTRLGGVSMNVTTGVSLRFDLDPHGQFTDYTKSLDFSRIAGRVQAEKGYDPVTTPLEPVTTSDGVRFFTQSGDPVPAERGDWLEFTLHFMSQDDMVVHLTSAPGREGDPGTRLRSGTPGLAPAMRISFTVGGETRIYDPGMGDEEKTLSDSPRATIFGLASEKDMVYNNSNALFPLTSGVDKTVVVRLWLEGTDEACTNELKGADYSLDLRFEGTTSDHQTFPQG